jgi:hypothetical protein
MPGRTKKPLAETRARRSSSGGNTSLLQAGAVEKRIMDISEAKEEKLAREMKFLENETRTKSAIANHDRGDYW